MSKLSHLNNAEKFLSADKHIRNEGRSPGLVAMGGDSCSKGCEFKSQHCRLVGHFSHTYLLKNLYCVFERMKINEKEAEVGPFLKKHIRNGGMRYWRSVRVYIYGSLAKWWIVEVRHVPPLCRFQEEEIFYGKQISFFCIVGWSRKELEVSTSLTISLVQYHHHQSLVSTYAEHSL